MDADTSRTEPFPLSGSALDSEPPREGETIGAYYLLDRIGQGGVGVVYRARDTRSDRLVALKTLQRMGAHDLLRFKTEFHSLLGNIHKNVVTRYELLGERDRWCFTMELVDGIDILRHVRPDGTAPVWEGEPIERLRDAFFQLAEGLSFLHSFNLLHRDIKPSNVLVKRDGTVVVVDFGLITPLDDRGIYQSTTEHFVGTPQYMSPEQSESKAVSYASDLYSVGVMLYQALTGQLPFGGR